MNSKFCFVYLKRVNLDNFTDYPRTITDDDYSKTCSDVPGPVIMSLFTF